MLRTLILTLCVAAGWQVAQAADVDTSPLPVTIAPAFPDLEFAGWEPDVNGKPFPLRPILLTNPGDGTNRLVVPQQQGQVHIFENKPGKQTTKLYFDLSKKVVYKDNENEEGFLGMAFHPKYKENGEFFVYYNTTDTPHTTVLSRFRVSAGDPNKADTAFEEELLRITHPFWNHKGGTICFGPDGYLYITLGDGGAGNDPLNNGQNLQTWLGKILRIDVDHKADGKNYAIPKDNPFVNVSAPGANKKSSLAQPEIYAYGFRNVWRMSFDRATGTLWAADVGQNVWEEIDLVMKGGNYGWNLREGLHPFTPSGEKVTAGTVDPIWEYHHDIGKSITGGTVYRGKDVPELEGYYVYGDYVTGKLWGLKYDEKAKAVVANRPIKHDLPSFPLISYGDSEEGEVYLMTVSPDGRGIYKFVKAAK